MSTSIIRVYGKLDDNVLIVKNTAKHIPKETTEIIISINSDGGKIKAANDIGSFISKLKTNYKCSITGQAINIGSAAIYLFLFCEKRIVCKKTTGKIHLPQGTLEGSDAREGAINLLTTKTKLSRAQILSLEGKELTGQQLYEYGFADTLVEHFHQAEQ